MRLWCKGGYGSLYCGLNVCMAGKTVWSYVNTCHIWAPDRGECYHNKALYKIRLILYLLYFYNAVLWDVFVMHRWTIWRTAAVNRQFECRWFILLHTRRSWKKRQMLLMHDTHATPEGLLDLDAWWNHSSQVKRVIAVTCDGNIDSVDRSTSRRGHVFDLLPIWPWYW